MYVRYVLSLFTIFSSACLVVAGTGSANELFNMHERVLFHCVGNLPCEDSALKQCQNFWQIARDVTVKDDAALSSFLYITKHPGDGKGFPVSALCDIAGINIGYITAKKLNALELAPEVPQENDAVITSLRDKVAALPEKEAAELRYQGANEVFQVICNFYQGCFIQEYEGFWGNKRPQLYINLRGIEKTDSKLAQEIRTIIPNADTWFPEGNIPARN
jgi:hypothetical protein